MRNNVKFDIDKIIKSPISKQFAKDIISSKGYRDDFLLGYNHFHDDGNKNIYKKWILENITSSNNLVLQNIFDLSLYTDVYSEILLKKSKIILAGRFVELTKLSCLDYLLSQRKKIPQRRFIDLNTMAYKNTKNIIVKFQAYFNLLVYDLSSLKKIKAILYNLDYPTLFYRFVNQIDLLPKNIQLEIKATLIADIERAKFNPKIKDELISKLKS